MKKKNKLVYVVGTNDADYNTHRTDVVNGKPKTVWTCPFYACWSNMLRRCYNEKRPRSALSYKDVEVCNEWHLFSNFKKWMETQDYNGKQLDKDLLIRGNRLYSPDTCIFIQNDINMLLVDTSSYKSIYPRGVLWNKASQKYQARLNLGKGQRKHLGLYSTPQEAHKAWQQAEIVFIENMSHIQEDTRVRYALLERCLLIQEAIKFSKETRQI